MVTDQAARRRQVNRIVFFLSVIVALTAVQTPLVPLLLSNIVTQSEADRLAETLRSATPGLLVALAVTYLYERSKDSAYQRSEDALAARLTAAVRTAFEHEDAARVDRYLASRPPREVLDMVLTRLLGSDYPAGTLSAALTPRRRMFRKVEIELTIRDSPDSDDEFIIDSGYRATVNDLPEIVLAYVADAQLAFQLSAACPEFSFIYSYESPSGVERAVAQATSSQSAIQYRVENDGRWSPAVYGSLDRVPASEYVNYGLPDDRRDHEPLILLRKNIPNGANNRVSYTLRSSGRSERAARFVYHAEDHLSYVERIRLDWSNFNLPADETFKPILIPFFPLAGPLPDIRDGTKQVDVVVEQWLLPGAGLILVW